MGNNTKPGLLGYEGQPPTYALADGRELPAGELVGQAADQYMLANPGLDASQREIAWNNLDDARRRDYCESTLELLDSNTLANSQAADAANVLDAVGDVAAEQLGADLIEAGLDACRSLKQPWKMTSEWDQGEIIRELTDKVQRAVTTTIRTLATRGSVHLVCELEQITVKKGAKAVLEIPKGSLDQDLLDAVGGSVLLVIGGSLLEARSITGPKPEKQQPELPLASADPLPPSDGNGGGEPDTGQVTHSDPED